MTKYIVIAGYEREGILYFGPFRLYEEAEDWLLRHTGKTGVSGEIKPLDTPS